MTIRENRRKKLFNKIHVGFAHKLQKNIYSRMLTSQLFSSGARTLRVIARRNFGITAPAMQKVSDPIQQLFLEKIKEYRSKGGDSKLVDSNPAVEKELSSELERIAKQFGGGEGVDMTKFPDFKFEEPKIDELDTK